MTLHRIAGLALALALTLASAGAAVAAEPKVDINTASAAELTTLPGVGDTLAQRIVDYREKQGPFTAPEQLMNVQDTAFIGSPERPASYRLLRL